VNHLYRAHEAHARVVVEGHEQVVSRCAEKRRRPLFDGRSVEHLTGKNAVLLAGRESFDSHGSHRAVGRGNDDDVAVEITQPDLTMLGKRIVEWTVGNVGARALNASEQRVEVIGLEPEN
jgi:hypothetical protein